MKKIVLLITLMCAFVAVFAKVASDNTNNEIWVDRYHNETPVPELVDNCYPKSCQTRQVSLTQFSGLATWFDATKNNAWYTQPNKWGKAIKFYGAAGPLLRRLMGHEWMAKPYSVIVTSEATGIAVRVWITDFCGCGGRASNKNDTRAIDLAPAVWDALGVDLSRGVMKVTIEVEQELSGKN